MGDVVIIKPAVFTFPLALLLRPILVWVDLGAKAWPTQAELLAWKQAYFMYPYVELSASYKAEV